MRAPRYDRTVVVSAEEAAEASPGQPAGYGEFRRRLDVRERYAVQQEGIHAFRKGSGGARTCTCGLLLRHRRPEPALLSSPGHLALPHTDRITPFFVIPSTDGLYRLVCQACDEVTPLLRLQSAQARRDEHPLVCPVLARRPPAQQTLTRSSVETEFGGVLLTITRTKPGEGSVTHRLVGTPSGLVIERDGHLFPCSVRTPQQALTAHPELTVARVDEVTRFVRVDPAVLTSDDVIAAIQPTRRLDPPNEATERTFLSRSAVPPRWASPHRISVDGGRVLAVALDDASLVAVRGAGGRAPHTRWPCLIDVEDRLDPRQRSARRWSLWRPRPDVLAAGLTYGSTTEVTFSRPPTPFRLVDVCERFLDDRGVAQRWLDGYQLSAHAAADDEGSVVVDDGWVLDRLTGRHRALLARRIRAHR